MKFFDLHIHPVLKTLFREPANAASIWDDIKMHDGSFHSILSSQSSMGMIARAGNMNLLVMPSHSLEKSIVEQFLLTIASKILYKPHIDFSRIHSIGTGGADCATVRAQEWAALNQPAPAGNPALAHKKVKVLTDMSEYDEHDMDTIHVLMSVEGAHNFYGKGNDDSNTIVTFNNLKDFISGDNLVLYVTLSHLAPSTFVNHAYGLKIFSKKKLMPVGNGIYQKRTSDPMNTKDGFDVLTMVHEAFTLIDIKHMSLHARKQFYKHRNDYFPDRPIIASHMGFTGFSWKDIPAHTTDIERIIDIDLNYYALKYIKEPGHLANTHYYPNSINMYDEDILEVLKSKGLIGLSLDIRILGAGGKKNDSDSDLADQEFISPSVDEVAEFTSNYAAVPPGKYTADKMAADLAAEDQEMKEFIDYNETQYKTLHMRHFINHLLHLCYLAQKNNLKVHPLEHVCIGSDFDGLIESIHCCKTISDMQSFADELKAALPACFAEAKIDPAMPVDTIVNNLFFDNAHRFIKQHYSNISNKVYKNPVIK